MTESTPATTIKPRQKRTYIPGPLPTEGYIRKPTFVHVLGISISSFNAAHKKGIIPPGKLLSPRTRVWNVREVRAYIAKVERESQTAPGPGVTRQRKANTGDLTAQA